MSAKDPDVRSVSESTLHDLLARSEERIHMLEAQLARAQQPLPGESADVPQASASLPTRPPISMSAFNTNSFGNNLSGPSAEAIAATVRAAANARNAPAPFSSLSDDMRDDFEPTARLDAGELRHAHRALTRPRTPAYRRIEAGLLCLACGALWAGVWQMRTGERNRQRADAPQITATAAPAADAYVVPPVSIRPVSVPPVSVPSLSALASAQREAGRLPIAADTRNGRTIVEPDAASRIVSASHSLAHVALPVNAPRHAQPLAATSRQDTDYTETRSYGRSAAARNRTPFLPPVVLPAEAPTTRREPNRKTLAVAHMAGLKHNPAKAAHLIAFMPHRAASFKPQPYSAVAAAPLPEARSSFGLGSGRSESSEEQVEEQAEAVHGTRAAAYERDDRHDDRHDDIEANVDHALQTLDKMKVLLDNMEHRRRSPTHP